MSQTERGRERERGANVSRGRGCTGATSKYGWGKLALIKLYTVAMETMAKIKKLREKRFKRLAHARVCVPSRQTCDLENGSRLSSCVRAESGAYYQVYLCSCIGI